MDSNRNRELTGTYQGIKFPDQGSIAGSTYLEVARRPEGTQTGCAARPNLTGLSGTTFQSSDRGAAVLPESIR